MSNIIRNNTSETWVNFIMANYKQVVLLVIVFLIIYSVEYVSYVNAMVYGMLAMPSIPGLTNSYQNPTNKKKKAKH